MGKCANTFAFPFPTEKESSLIEKESEVKNGSYNNGSNIISINRLGKMEETNMKKSKQKIYEEVHNEKVKHEILKGIEEYCQGLDRQLKKMVDDRWRYLK